MLRDVARLAALDAAAVLDTPPDPAFDRLSQLARDALGAAAAYVVFVGADRQFIKSCAADDRSAAGTSTPLSHSLCRHAVEAGAPLAITDGARDPRFASHPAVAELGIAAYLGAPITSEDGQVLGTVCVTEPAPRAWAPGDVAVLCGVAAAAGREHDLRAANRQLAERERLLVDRSRERDAVFAAMHDVVLVLDRDGTYLRAFPTAPELLYRPGEEMVGRRVHDFLPPPAADAFVATVRRALAEGRPVTHDYALDLPAAAGRPPATAHFHAVVSPLDGEAGTVLWVARDVSAGRAAEEALRANEVRLRAIYSAAPVGVFEADETGSVWHVNPCVCDIWRQAEEEMLDDGWQARVHADDLGPLLAEWRAAGAAGREFTREFRLLVPAAADGVVDPAARPEVRWVRGRVAPLRDAAGRVVGSVGTAEDVTDRHRAETTQRRLTGILEAMPDVVTVTAPSGRIQYLNAAGRRLLGVAGGPDAVREAGLDVRAVQPQFAPGGSSAAAVAAAMLEGAWRGETTLTKCDGREMPVEQVILAHRDADGEIEYLSSILRDVTERKQAEATLRAFALVDELTGLYNRRGFLALAEREWEAARAAGQGALLVYLDLDGFKAINDTYGHAEGDRALAAVAGVLRRTFRDADVVGRLGGDEFVAFARTGAAGPRALEHARETAARVQQRLQALLAEATLAAGRPYTLAGSAGVALFDPAAPATLSSLMVEADAALYDRKRARKRPPRGAAA
jgi:diguanylate cyclase (GGDEF)-like protein/PAS domain S-box-containing protein